MKQRRFAHLLTVVIAGFVAANLAVAQNPAVPATAGVIRPLQVRGEDFVAPDGQAVRFWGANLVAFYPTHEVADKVAANLASRQINLVRPHHMLRPSSDWVVDGAPIVALQDYKSGSTRQPDSDAWDRFDYLNSALRRNGIYLMLAIWWTRQYQPADVDVLQTTPDDRKAWMDAITELNSWGWKKAFDPRKILCTVDERVAALEEEFARQLLTHVNPYTKLAYGQDPQVLTLELQNECSSEYIFVCQNRFPDYFQKKLLAKWEAFARQAGAEPGDFYKPANARMVALRSQFCRKLDEGYLKRMKSVIWSAGSMVPVEFSNLWEGESAQQMYARSNDFIEDHMYADPMVAGRLDDFVYKLSKTPIAGKPFIVGELNQSESAKLMPSESPVRTMLPVAAAAYGLLHRWSGITFFAWNHGDKLVGPDGWSTAEGRNAEIGQLISDGMQLDHLRTCGVIFRRGLLQGSVAPITMHVDDPVTVGDYNGLMRGKYTFKPGWQDIHDIRKAYGPVPPQQANAPWMKQSPANPLVSDTKQIVKDIERKQLTVVAPQAEAFSGYLDGKAPAGLKHLEIAGDGFATVVMVADDGKEFAGSSHLVLSRTNVDKTNTEVAGPVIHLAGLQQPQGGRHWEFHLTRPRAVVGKHELLQVTDNGQVTLPSGDWHECELELK